MKLKVPPRFSLTRTATSHGWVQLPPFKWDLERRVLKRVLRRPGSSPVLVEISQPRAGELSVCLRRVRPAGRGRRRGKGLPIADQIRHMLRLDEPLDEFYASCRKVRGFAWLPPLKMGRLLRAPDPFEDLVKLICTTNCTWALTRLMVGGLVAGLGEPVKPVSGEAGEWNDFPSPRRMAGAPPAFYQGRIKAGYRGPYLRELARRVASGRLDPGSWLDPEMPSDVIAREIGSVKGAGRYVVENMMKLLGRYEGLGLDSWVRKEFSRRHNGGRPASDASIARHYEPFGRWRGLALWCDVTRGWHDKFPDF